MSEFDYSKLEVGKVYDKIPIPPRKGRGSGEVIKLAESIPLYGCYRCKDVAEAQRMTALFRGSGKKGIQARIDTPAGTVIVVWKVPEDYERC